MRLAYDSYGAAVVREPGDPRLRTESAAVTALVRLLRKETGRRWVRFDPSGEGLTGCRLGAADRKAGRAYWHERYQIEAAHLAYNAGEVRFMLAEAWPRPAKRMRPEDKRGGRPRKAKRI